MDTNMLEQLKNRRSCRKFDKDRTIEEEKINQVINAGLYLLRQKQ